MLLRTVLSSTAALLRTICSSVSTQKLALQSGTRGAAWGTHTCPTYLPFPLHILHSFTKKYPLLYQKHTRSGLGAEAQRKACGEECAGDRHGFAGLLRFGSVCVGLTDVWPLAQLTYSSLPISPHARFLTRAYKMLRSVDVKGKRSLGYRVGEAHRSKKMAAQPRLPNWRGSAIAINITLFINKNAIFLNWVLR